MLTKLRNSWRWNLRRLRWPKQIFLQLEQLPETINWQIVASSSAGQALNERIDARLDHEFGALQQSAELTVNRALQIHHRQKLSSGGQPH